MPKDYTTETEVVYCGTSDVASELLKDDGFFGENNSPHRLRVVKMIKQAEEYIDNQTGTAWRIRKRVNEYKSFRFNQQFLSNSGYRFKLDRNFVRELDATEGDKLEIWSGSSWEDWLSTKQEGRDKDFWFDYETGYLYLRQFIFRGYEKPIKLTYRYGADYVPPDINDICAKLVAIKLLTNEDSSFILEEAGNPNTMQYDPRINAMRNHINNVIKRYSDFGYTL